MSLNHRRYPSVGRADSPVNPIAYEISPDESFNRFNFHFSGIIAIIEKFLFQPCPHAFALCIIMASATYTIHTLENAIFTYCFSVELTSGVLTLK